MKRYLVVLFACIVMFSVEAFGQSMGWLQAGYGTFEYNDTANWRDGVINGVFGTNMTAKATQDITFGSDFNITSNTFIFTYPGEITYKFHGDGSGDVTATLLDDLIMYPATHKGSMTFGSTSAGSKLNFDLAGGTRTFNNRMPVYIYNTINNGDIVKIGAGNFYMTRDASAPDSDIAIEDGGIFYFDSSVANITGGVRAASVRLSTSELYVQGNSLVESFDTVTGNLIIDGTKDGGCPFISIRSNGKNAQLVSETLTHKDGSVAIIRGSNLGDTPAAGIANFFVNTAPTIIGGNGSAGSTSISILPWALGSTSYTGGGNATYDQTFLTYESANGFRPLDLDTEYTNEVASGEVTTENVLVPTATTWTMTTNITINSLLLQGSELSTNTLVTGTGTLTIKSGHVLLGYHRYAQPVIDVPIDFGSSRGYIGYPQGKGSSINGTINGTGGVVFYQPTLTDGSGNLHVSTACEYSGDTYVYGFVSLSDESLPHGSRLGDVYAYSKLMINTTTMNGLNGTGEFNKPNSGNGTLTIGDNDANGNFNGTITQFGNRYIVKIGNGNQRFGGACLHKGTTIVNAGTLIVDGTIEYSPITVNSGATFAGAGEILPAGTNLTISAGGILAPGSSNGVGNLNVTGGMQFNGNATMKIYADASGGYGSISLGAAVAGVDHTVSVEVTGEGSGEWLILQAATIEPDFISVTPGALLTLRENGTELWLTRAPQGSILIIQ